jgi:gluconate 2-dehydrogenase gamma chain
MSQDTTNVSRRGLFQILGVAGASAAAFAEAPQHTHEAVAAASTHGKPTEWRIFDAHQQKTAAALSDLIFPADEHGPAASATGVVAFIDDWIAFRTEEDGYDRLQAEVLGGFMWLDRESNQLFNKDFADASPDQKKQIADRLAWPARAAKEDQQWAEFFNTFRDLVVSGYFSSKQGVADLPYLGNVAVPVWKGCDPKVWSIIEDRLNNGYRGLLSPNQSA